MKKIISIFILLNLLFISAQAQFAVGHTTITYNDPARSNRAIATEIYYPAASAGNNVPVTGGTYPVITFGHGFVMVTSAYQNIWESLVATGYIVALPSTEGSFSPVHADFGADLAFLIGAIQADGANSNSLFYNHVGTTSAVMGHSMGGGSAFLAAANSSNITTMVTLAAANTTPSSITAAAQISIPSLVISGQNDCVAPPAQHQIPMYDSLASFCKAYIEITGGGHCYFANTNFNCSFGEGTCTPNPTITRNEQQDAAQDMALLWLNYYLKEDCAAWTAFTDSLNNSNRFTGISSCNVQNPVITQNGNTLQSSPAATYQWLLNGNPVAGANAQNYTPVQNGVYTVQVTYYNSCPYISNQINFTALGFADADFAGGFSLFPNPANENTSIQFFSAVANRAEIKLYSLPGKLVSSNTITVLPGQNKTEINLEGIAAGSYLLVLNFADGQQFCTPLIRN